MTKLPRTAPAMLKPLAGTAFLLLLLAPPALAQEPDTTSAWRYFPLEVGNVWEYDGLGLLTHSRDYRIEVESDTLIEGQHYFVVAFDAIRCSPCIERWHVRFDLETGRMVEHVSGGEDVPWWYANCELNAPFGSETTCGETSGGYEESFELADGSVLEGVTYKVFNSGFDLHGYVADVGFVTEAILQYEPGEARLRYARVGGVEYGTPFEVGTEAAAPAPASALRVYPNPLRDTGTVELTLGEPQHAGLAVYDVLGRRVLRLHEGPLPTGRTSLRFEAGALAPGVYFVRKADGSAETAFTIAR